MRPISSSLIEISRYFLLSSDFVSQSNIKKILLVSVFLIANLMYGCFSSRGKKEALTIASMRSASRWSSLAPRV